MRIGVAIERLVDTLGAPRDLSREDRSSPHRMPYPIPRICIEQLDPAGSRTHISGIQVAYGYPYETRARG